MGAAPRYYSFVEFAKIEFFPAQRGHFEIFNSEFSLEFDETILEFLAFSTFVLIISKLKLFRDGKLLAQATRTVIYLHLYLLIIIAINQ